MIDQDSLRNVAIFSVSKNETTYLYFRVMSRNYKFHNKSGLYFVSFATVFWADVFTREQYLCVLTESIDYCRSEKVMEVYLVVV